MANGMSAKGRSDIGSTRTGSWASRLRRRWHASSTQSAGGLAVRVKPRALDIEERRAVEAVEADHVEFAIMDGEDFDYSRCDGVGPHRGAHGKDTDRLVAHARAYRKLHHIAPARWSQ